MRMSRPACCIKCGIPQIDKNLKQKPPPGSAVYGANGMCSRCYQRSRHVRADAPELTAMRADLVAYIRAMRNRRGYADETLVELFPELGFGTGQNRKAPPMAGD